MYVHDPEPELEPEPEPEPEPYSDNMAEPEPSSNFPVPQPGNNTAKDNTNHFIDSASEKNNEVDSIFRLIDPLKIVVCSLISVK
jgi:hypothetical protein